jgi:hypothetical protein
MLVNLRPLLAKFSAFPRMTVRRARDGQLFIIDPATACFTGVPPIKWLRDGRPRQSTEES